MSYSFNSSSSPPSTPDRTPQKGNKGFAFGASNPSTTPAGPPPSSAGSFTPAGPPPSSIFGSSVLGATGQGKPLTFSKQNPFERSSTAPRSALRNEYQSSSSEHRGYHANLSGSDGEYYSEEHEQLEGDEYSEDYGEDDDQDASGIPDEDAMAYDEDPQYEEDQHMGDLPSERRSNFEVSRGSRADSLLNSSLRNSEGAVILRGSMGQSYATRSKEPTYGTIAKDLFTQMGVSNLEESDDIILKTESCMERLYAEGIGAVDSEDRLSEALTVTSSELLGLWSSYDERTRAHNSQEYVSVIGPGPQSSNFAKANFIAQLALRIYQPGSIDHDQFKYGPRPLPASILEWIDKYHEPLPEHMHEILGHKPCPSNHPQFWGVILHTLLRGHISAVTHMLKQADWHHAFDQSSEGGYVGAALANVKRVIGSAVQTLELCPAAYKDWNIGNSDWTLFRVQAAKALDDLGRFAEGRYRDADEGRSATQRTGTFSQTARKAESRVPWYLYQNLLTLYNLVLGDSTAAIATAQDWCEATVGLMLWRNEDKHRDLFTSSRRKSVFLPSDEHTWNNKLRKCFESATAESTDLQVNTLDPVQVALASLFEGNNEAVVGFLRAWSGPVSAAVAEIASCGLWLPRVEPQSLIDMNSLDQEGMDLLGISASPSKADSVKDQTLISYARALSRRGLLKTSSPAGHEIKRRGWELAVANLGRLDSAQRSEEMVVEFLRTLPLRDSDTVDKLWKLLVHLGMTQHAQSTAESYADKLAEETHEYGRALWYYSLSHNAQKVKDVLDLLISISLTQSTAYPPKSELDSHLKQLVTSPATTLAELSSLDIDAAKLLHRLLSGYATIRYFYFLRDQELMTSKGQKPHAGPIVRKIEAATALLAIITSADDNIRGGLYDESRGAIVSVDFLLALLGEALVFLNDPDFLFSTSQIELLLRTIEDLQGVTSRVYLACNEFLQTVLASTSGLKGSTPADMLRKSTSNLSGSSFSLTGSSMLASQLQKSVSSSGFGKGNIKRGWDWRKGMNAAMSGEELLRMLRLGLARALATAWIKEADGRVVF